MLCVPQCQPYCLFLEVESFEDRICDDCSELHDTEWNAKCIGVNQWRTRLCWYDGDVLHEDICGYTHIPVTLYEEEGKYYLEAELTPTDEYTHVWRKELDVDERNCKQWDRLPLSIVDGYGGEDVDCGDESAMMYVSSFARDDIFPPDATSAHCCHWLMACEAWCDGCSPVQDLHTTPSMNNLTLTVWQDSLVDRDCNECDWAGLWLARQSSWKGPDTKLPMPILPYCRRLCHWYYWDEQCEGYQRYLHIWMDEDEEEEGTWRFHARLEMKPSTCTWYIGRHGGYYAAEFQSKWHDHNLCLDPDIVFSESYGGHNDIVKMQFIPGSEECGPTNLITNPSFEAWTGSVLDNWTVEAGTLGVHILKHTAVPDPQHLLACLKFTGDGSQEEIRVSQEIVLQPSTKYLLSAWVRGDTDVSSGTLTIEFRGTGYTADGDERIQLNAGQLDGMVTWQRFSFFITTPPELPGNFRIVVEVSDTLSNGDRVFADQMDLTEQECCLGHGPCDCNYSWANTTLIMHYSVVS